MDIEEDHHHHKEHHQESSSSSSPHEAMFFVLAYLHLYELLVMTRVCRSLRRAVETDIIPWLKNIVVDRPLSSRIDDEHLLKIVLSKAKGRRRLQSLTLINCLKITDSALLRIASQNPHITKLHVPGCTSLTPKGITEAAKLLNKLETLHVNGIYNISNEDYQTLLDLIDPPLQNQKRKEIYYHTRTSPPNVERPIDVGICPKCEKVRMVFDCPRDECKGCYPCIVRCSNCGACLDRGEEFEESCCGDELCFDCWLKLPKCSFCNKPYCSMHFGQGHNRIEGGFVCSKCYYEFNSSN